MIRIAITINIRFVGFIRKSYVDNPLVPLSSGIVSSPSSSSGVDSLDFSLIIREAVTECDLPPPEASIVTV